MALKYRKMIILSIAYLNTRRQITWELKLGNRKTLIMEGHEGTKKLEALAKI